MTPPISLLRALALPLALMALASGAALPARAQPAPPPLGARVIDSKGKAVGKVEKIIAERDGRPSQVQVRVDRILRTLPIDALAPGREGVYVCVLSRAEIVSLPPSD